MSTRKNDITIAPLQRPVCNSFNDSMRWTFEGIFPYKKVRDDLTLDWAMYHLEKHLIYGLNRPQ
jgi:hypothetical protein